MIGPCLRAALRPAAALAMVSARFGSLVLSRSWANCWAWSGWFSQRTRWSSQDGTDDEGVVRARAEDVEGHAAIQEGLGLVRGYDERGAGGQDRLTERDGHEQAVAPSR